MDFCPAQRLYSFQALPSHEANSTPRLRFACGEADAQFVD